MRLRGFPACLVLLGVSVVLQSSEGVVRGQEPPKAVEPPMRKMRNVPAGLVRATSPSRRKPTALWFTPRVSA